MVLQGRGAAPADCVRAQARLAQALDEKDAAVADRCRAIFELLSKNTQHELAKSEMRTSYVTPFPPSPPFPYLLTVSL